MNFIISQKEQLQEIVNHYGTDHQKDKLFEEMAELQKEVCKEKDGKGDIPHIAEELADVYIMLQQMQLIYGITDEQIEQVVQEKIERTLDVIEGEDNE
jgi:NTP pyrophosphatase (non-canonical NTP hydrolase)